MTDKIYEVFANGRIYRKYGIWRENMLGGKSCVGWCWAESPEKARETGEVQSPDELRQEAFYYWEYNGTRKDEAGEKS